MSWDPWVQEEIRGPREDQERRAFEAHLRRNPDEEERITDAVYNARVRQIKNAQAFNEIVKRSEAAQQEVNDIRGQIRLVSHGGFYKCREGAILGGFFSGQSNGDPSFACLYRTIAALAWLFAIATAAVAGPTLILAIAA
jgi:hypothetical protein